MFALHDLDCPLGMTGTHHQQGKTSLICVARRFNVVYHYDNFNIEYYIVNDSIENDFISFDSGKLKPHEILVFLLLLL